MLGALHTTATGIQSATLSATLSATQSADLLMKCHVNENRDNLETHRKLLKDGIVYRKDEIQTDRFSGGRCNIKPVLRS